MGAVGIAEIERAADAIRGSIRSTPTLAAGELSHRFGAPVRLKAENLQRTGSFKIRGAINRLARLSEAELQSGVVAGSAGNHAQALALAARERSIRAELFMPAEAPLAKIEAVRSNGGEVRLVPGSYDEAAAAAAAHAKATGATLIHPFDDPDVVAGQGTIGLEIAAEAPATRLIVVAVGGGALAAGVAIAAKDRLPDLRVVGVRSAAYATYPAESVGGRDAGTRAHAPSTICDGIAVKAPGELTAPLVATYVDEVVTVSDDEVAEAMVLLLERSKLVVEGAGAASVAALLAGKIAVPSEGEVCAILSGGNVDASRLAECIRLGETAAGRRLVLATVLPDRPGALARLLATVAEQGANVIDVAHLREGVHLHIRETEIRLVLQTDGRAHAERILGAIREHGFDAREEAERRRTAH